MPLQYATAKNVTVDNPAFFEIPPLRRFYEKAPSWSRIALERGKGLTKPLPKKTALRDGQLIQFNSAKLVSYLVFDIDEPHPDDSSDYPSCFYNWFYADVPPPTFIVSNNKNGHCQYFYELKTPVSISHKSAPKPQFYLHAIRKQMTLELNADSAYTHAISKNPFNCEKQTVYYCLAEPYELSDLDNLDHEQNSNFKPSNPDDYLGLGRNNDIFHTVRFDAYAYKANCDRYEQLYDFILSECRALNAEIGKSHPNGKLSDNEVRSTVKSIARWTWDNYTGRGKHADKYFSKQQAKRGKKGGKAYGNKIKKNNARKRQKALKLVEQGISKAEVARQLKISRKTVTRWCQDAQK